MNIGQKIRSLRRNAKLTQTQLAKTLGVSTGAVGLWEVNKREPDTATLSKISKEFKVSVDYLLDNQENNTITIIGSNGSYTKFQLSEEKLNAIAQLAETMATNKD